jgi:hypothetical protein
MKINKKQRFCGDCAYLRLGGGICVLENEQIPATEIACRKFRKNIDPCDLCGRYSKTPLIRDITDEPILSVCDECLSKYNTCITCKETTHCEFDTNPSPTPKFVRREIRNGNMITVTQIRNPDRIRELCQGKCSCFDEKVGCLRENKSCGKWEIRHGQIL